MTLLIAVADPRADEELVASARNLAKAAGWAPRVVHVREAGGAELGSADLADLEIVDLEGDAPATIAGLAAKADLQAVAIGLRPVGKGKAGTAKAGEGRAGKAEAGEVKAGGGDAGAGLGRVAKALLEAGVAPLLLVRPGMRPLTGLRRLVVPLEGSPSASGAMKRADDALCARGREIVMLHVVTGSTPGETGSFPAPRIVDQEHYEWSAWQEEFTMRFSQCPEGGRHRVAVRVGKPAPAIAEEARNDGAELIVLSWGGTFAGGHGAVVRELLETAPCPLFVIPPEPVAG
jgi:nucleotide-binding universal stress UspA family protein